MAEEIITSRHNPLLTHVRKLASSRGYRSECGEYLGDGTKLLDEAVKWGAPLTAVICTEGTALPPLPQGVRLVRVPEDVMRSVSPMESPQGVLFTVRLPDRALPKQLTGWRYLVLDGVQDPGNVGTILRTADAFSCNAIFLVNACADAFNPKTVRATMGAIFRREVYSCDVQALSALLTASDLPLYGTALRRDTTDLRTAALGRCAVAIGSEGRGLSEEVIALCEKTIKIPMEDCCESLNAAAAACIVLWEMYR